MSQHRLFRSLRRDRPIVKRIFSGALLILLIGFSGRSAEGGAGAAQPASPTPGWTTGNEWLLAGNYAEACTDPPLCPGLFGAATCGGPCRKIMMFQILRGRYHNIDLSGISAVAAVESPADGAIVPTSRSAWPRCDLLISDEADSAQAAGLAVTLGAMVLGAGGPAFSHIEVVPLSFGFSGTHVVAESAGRLLVRLQAVKSLNKVTAPDLNNLGSSFPWLGPLYIYEADTLYFDAASAGARDRGRGTRAEVRGASESGAEAGHAKGTGAPAAWNGSHRSGIVSQFVWNSEMAYEEAGVAAHKP